MSNSLTVEMLRFELENLGLDSKGAKSQLRQRLKKAKAVSGDSKHLNTDPIPDANRSNWMPSFDSFLVLDVEASCEKAKRYGSTEQKDVGPTSFPPVSITSYHFPNEIIEFPAILLQWNQNYTKLQVIDTFQTYVCPTWRPQLSEFCKNLTGIRQEQVDSAPVWKQTVQLLHAFLHKHNLFSASDVSNIHDCRLRRGVTWITHGPSDLREFVIKQCWISAGYDRCNFGTPPMFMRGPLIDVRQGIAALFGWEMELTAKALKAAATKPAGQMIEFGGKDGFQVIERKPTVHPPPSWAANLSTGTLTMRDLSVVGLLELLQLGKFEGREHCGLDDTKNIARLVIEIGRRITEMSHGKQTFISRQICHDAAAETIGVTAPVTGKLALDRAIMMEKLCLTPNIRTDRVNKRWKFMGSRVGHVLWSFAPEDESVLETRTV